VRNPWKSPLWGREVPIIGKTGGDPRRDLPTKGLCSGKGGTDGGGDATTFRSRRTLTLGTGSTVRAPGTNEPRRGQGRCRGENVEEGAYLVNKTGVSKHTERICTRSKTYLKRGLVLSGAAEEEKKRKDHGPEGTPVG